MARIVLTAEIRETLNTVHQDTGVGPQRLLKGKPDKPRGLNSTTIYHWMDGTLETAKQEHLDWVLNEWRETRPLIPFTPEDVNLFKQELERTGYTQTSLLRRLSPVPESLTPDVLHRLCSKRLENIDKEHKEFLFENLAKLPSKNR